MDLLKYRDTVESFESLAKKAGTSAAYLTQLAHGHRQPSPKLCFRIEKASAGQVSRADLRPDIFGTDAAGTDYAA